MPLRERSYTKIERPHLERLLQLAEQDRNSLFSRRPETGKLYADRILCTALCQGAAQHFVDGEHGVKDFDVWTFYRAHPKRPFPYRRVGRMDFGLSDFGRHPKLPMLTGRRVDLIGRSIPHREDRTPIDSLVDYLQAGSTKSAKLIAARPVVLLSPDLGLVIPPQAA
jgi:hypothetical protein